jgi:AraC-like DNA-binding protein
VHDAPHPGTAGALRAILSLYLEDEYPHAARIAEVFGVSVRSLQRKLSRAGVSDSERVDETRVAIAMERLAESDGTILELAMSIGCNDSSHFTRAFRRETSISPREYRRNARSATLGRAQLTQPGV